MSTTENIFRRRYGYLGSGRKIPQIIARIWLAILAVYGAVSWSPIRTSWGHPLRNLVLAGLIINIPLTLFTSWSDTTKFWHMTNKLYAAPDSMLTFYPPPWLLTMKSFTWPFAQIGDPSNFAVAEPVLRDTWYQVGINQQYVTSPEFNFALKLPLLIAVFAIGVLIYAIVNQWVGQRMGRLAFAFWIFNPFTILSASVLSQTDVLVALFMLMSFYFILKHDFMFAGMSLGLSVFFKTYNIYVVILFGLIVAFELGRTSKGRYQFFISSGLKNSLKYCMGFIVPFVLLLPSMFVFDSLWQEWLETPRLAGFNIWGVISELPSASNTEVWANNHLYTIQEVQFWIGAIVAFAVAIFMTFRRKGDITDRLLLGIAGIMSITFLTLTLTNPHQIISMLPFVILLGVRFSGYLLKYWAISVAAVAYILLLRGPYQILFPLASYTDIISIEKLAELTVEFAGLSGIVNDKLNRDAMLFSSIIGTAVLVWLFIESVITKPNLVEQTNEEEAQAC